MKKKKKKNNKATEKRFAIKLVMCLMYVIIITILFVCSYQLFEEKKNIVAWEEVENVEDYTYVKIYKMSEKFAYYKTSNIGIHFVIEKEEDGLWHTFLVAINEEDYDNYKAIIDYTYERTDKEPKPIKVYGYPVITSDELKELAIKNIVNFLPADNEVTITENNYDAYLTNSYLDTTRKKEDKFSIVLFISFLSLVIVFALLIATLFDRDRIVDKVDKHLDEDIDRARLMFQRSKRRKNKKKNKGD